MKRADVHTVPKFLDFVLVARNLVPVQRCSSRRNRSTHLEALATFLQSHDGDVRQSMDCGELVSV